MTVQIIENKIQNLYSDFFFENNINNKSGIWNNKEVGRELRFATMPHIGDYYASAQIKILFVGLDIGEDEFGRIQTFDERRSRISMPKDDYFDKNPHMAGTYIETLAILKNIYPSEWNDVYRMRDNPNGTVLKNLKNILPIDLLRSVAMTNYYKFVTKDRQGRRGSFDRDNFGISNEIKKLFLSEVEILNPDIVWFQGIDFESYEVFKKLKTQTIKKIICTYHPSYVREKEVFGEIVITNTPHYADLIVEHNLM